MFWDHYVILNGNTENEKVISLKRPDASIPAWDREGVILSEAEALADEMDMHVTRITVMKDRVWPNDASEIAVLVAEKFRLWNMDSYGFTDWIRPSDVPDPLAE